MPENLYLGKRKDYIFPVDWRLSPLCACVCVCVYRMCAAVSGLKHRTQKKPTVHACMCVGV